MSEEGPAGADKQGHGQRDTGCLDAMARALMERHAREAEPLAPVRISRRMKRTLGSYSPSKRQIAISHRLLSEGTDEEVRAVLLHEVAHAIVHHRHGEARPHGPLFKQVCREIGAEPSARTTVSLRPDPTQTRYVFSCPACKRTLSRKRLLRFARCRCGARLEVKVAARMLLDSIGRAARLEGYFSPRGR